MQNSARKFRISKALPKPSLLSFLRKHSLNNFEDIIAPGSSSLGRGTNPQGLSKARALLSCTKLKRKALYNFRQYVSPSSRRTTRKHYKSTTRSNASKLLALPFPPPVDMRPAVQTSYSADSYVNATDDSDFEVPPPSARRTRTTDPAMPCLSRKP